MKIIPSTYQLTFELDIPEDEEAISGLSHSAIQARKEDARAMVHNGSFFDKDDDGNPIIPYWFDSYLRFAEGGYPFRVAVYAAWIGTPKSKRVPKTKKELADILGLSSPRQFSVWEQKNPQIRIEAGKIWKNRVLDALPESVDAMLEVASRPDYKGKYDRAMHFKMAGELDDTINLTVNDDLSGRTTEELKQLLSMETKDSLAKDAEEEDE